MIISFPEAEEALMMYLIRKDIPLKQMLEQIKTEDFYEEANRMLFRYICEMTDDGRSVDAISLMQTAKEKQHPELAINIGRILQATTAMTPQELCDVLRRYRWRREGIVRAQLLRQQLEDLTSDVVEVVAQASTDLASLTLDGMHPLTNLSEAALDVARAFGNNLDPATRAHCVSTGFGRIDNTGGLPPVGITVVAADTGQGKSSLAVDLAMQNVAQGEKVAFYNLEMPTTDMARRIIAARTGIPFYTLAYGTPSPDELLLVERTADELQRKGGERFLFDQRMPDSLEGILASMRRLADPRGEGVRHFYVDYLQILSWTGDERHMQWRNIEQLLAQATRRFQNLCLELNIQIVLTSQVNRDIAHNELTLDRIRDSKQIADAASSVLLINRPEAYGECYKTEEFRDVDPHGTALFSLAKRRNGPCMSFIVGFDAPRTTFYELDRIPRLTSQPGTKPW